MQLKLLLNAIKETHSQSENKGQYQHKKDKLPLERQNLKTSEKLSIVKTQAWFYSDAKSCISVFYSISLVDPEFKSHYVAQ